MARPIPARGTSWHRLLNAAIGVLLLAGAVELHPTEAHSVDGRERLVWTCDHDGAPSNLHAEAAQAELREACPACLHRLQTAGAGWTSSGAFAGMVVAEPGAVDRDPFLSPAHPRRQPARGPPALS